jgi:hypothetical protein
MVNLFSICPVYSQAIPANPILEEAYLLFQEEIGQAERAEAFASPKQISPP